MNDDDKNTKAMLTRWTVDLVETAFAVPRGAVTSGGRGSATVTTARQIACYLVALRLGYSATETGRILRRHSTTVAHSLRRVEDMREDSRLNARINAIEEQLDVLKGMFA